MTGDNPTAATLVDPVVDRIDRVQRRRPLLAFPFAVFKRYGEDNGGWVSALISYYGFFSLFPLLVVFVSVATWILELARGLAILGLLGLGLVTFGVVAGLTVTVTVPAAGLVVAAIANVVLGALIAIATYHLSIAEPTPSAG